MHHYEFSLERFNEYRLLPINQLVHRLREEAEAAKAHFLSLDLAAVLHDKLTLGREVRAVYQSTALFPDEGVIQRLKVLGLKDAYLIWFKPVEAILTHFDDITADDTVTMDKNLALLWVRFHLDNKVGVDLFSFLRLTSALHDNPHAPRFAADLRKLYRKRKRAIKLGRPLLLKGEYEQLLYGLIQDADHAVGDPELAEAIFMQVATGNTRKVYLSRIVAACSTQKKNNAFYRRFFPLFKLICPDEELLSEDDFVNTEHNYGRSYKSYQAKRVKDLIREGKRG